MEGEEGADADACARTARQVNTSSTASATAGSTAQKSSTAARDRGSPASGDAARVPITERTMSSCATRQHATDAQNSPSARESASERWGGNG